MPRVKMDPKAFRESMIKKRSSDLRRRLKVVGQKEIAAELDKTQPAISQKMKNGRFTYDELLIIFKEFDFSDEEILKAMKL